MSNAKRGSDFERRVKKALEEAGWLVVKSGGSLGCADLLAIGHSRRPLLVQCKSGAKKISVEEWNELFEVAINNEAQPILATRGLRTEQYPILYFRIMGWREKNSRLWPSAAVSLVEMA